MLWLLLAAFAADLPLSTPTTVVSRGDTVVVHAEAEVPVWFVLSDGTPEPICPKVLDPCLDLTGGWLAFGPVPSEDGRATLKTTLPPGFQGARLQAQALTRVDGALRTSPVISWTVTGAPSEAGKPTTALAREAILAPLQMRSAGPDEHHAAPSGAQAPR